MPIVGSVKTIENISLELIRDNPFNPRSTYSNEKISELAASISQVGLIQIPQARKAKEDGFYELAYGGYRLRAYKLLSKKNDDYKLMPLEVVDLTDEQMALYALEENLKRNEMKALDAARAINDFLSKFPSISETDFAKKLSMTQAGLSNMLRVLKLPEEILTKVNEDRINFTMARELLIFTGLSADISQWHNGKNESVHLSDVDLMKAAIDKTAPLGSIVRGFDTQPCTVEGIDKAIDITAAAYFRPLKKGTGNTEILFDAIGTGCIDCKKCLLTHPKKKESNHWCTDAKCWDVKQEEHKQKQAAEAKTKVEQELKKKIEAEAPAPPIKVIPQEIPEEEDKTVEVSEFSEPKASEVQVSYSADIIASESRIHNPFSFLEELHVCVGQSPKGGETIFKCYLITPAKKYKGVATSFSAIDSAIRRDNPKGFYDGVLVKWGKKDYVLTGPPLTFVYNSDKSKAEAPAKKQSAADQAGKVIFDTPKNPPIKEVPQEISDKVKAQQGTRAEIIDTASYGKELAILGAFDNPWDKIDCPEECKETCTHGFHYGYNSRESKPESLLICTDLKCLTKKKGDLTRKKNAAGQALKKAESKAVSEVLAKTTELDIPRMKIIILAMLTGCYYIPHTGYGPGIKGPDELIWNTIDPKGEIDRNLDNMMAKIDTLSKEFIAQLITNFMLYSMAYKGDVEDYKIKLTKPMEWLGVKLETK